VEASAFDRDYQRKLFFPRLDFNASTGYFDGVPFTPFSVVRGITEEGETANSASGGYLFATPTLTVPIVRDGVPFGYNAPTVNMATQQIMIDEESLAGAKNELILAVTTSFFSLLKNAQDIQAAEEHMRSLELDHKIATSKFAEELISKNDLLMAEVNLASGQKDLLLFKTLSLTLSADLATQMGLKPSPAITVSEEAWSAPPLPPLDQLIATAVSNRPEIKAQKARVSQAQEERRQAANQRYPNVNVNASYGIGYDYHSRDNSLWTTVLEFNMPIFDFGLVSARLKNLDARVTEADKNLLTTTGAITQEVITAFTGISNTTAEISLQEKICEQSLENARLVRGRFDQNLSSLSAVLEAEYAVYANQKALVQARYDLTASYLQLQEAIGTPRRETPAK
jgi:outer membrane protein TolC